MVLFKFVCLFNFIFVSYLPHVLVEDCRRGGFHLCIFQSLPVSLLCNPRLVHMITHSLLLV